MNASQQLHYKSAPPTNIIIPTFHLGEFKTIKKLGDGKFGKVLLISTSINHNLSTQKNDQTNEFLYAVKIINNKKLGKSTLNYSKYTNLNKIRNEVKIIDVLNKFDHPYLLKMYSIINNENNDKIYFIMDYCKLGELTHDTFLNFPKNVDSLINVQSKLKNIINALEFLHSQKIVHRDIKPSNLLVDSNGVVKISDFGTCYQMTGDIITDDFEVSKKLTGTPLFMPPEIVCNETNSPTESTATANSSSSIHSHGGHSKKKSGFFGSFKLKKDSENFQDNALKIDVWSLGITFYFLFFENFPFYQDNEFKLFNDIVNKEIKFPDNLENVLMFRKLRDQKKSDATFNKNLINYFQSLIHLLQKMLIKDPCNRPTVKSIRSHPFFKCFTEPKDYQQFIKFNNKFTKNLKYGHDQEGYFIRNSESKDLISDHYGTGGDNSGFTTRMKGPFAKLFNLTPSNSTQSVHSQLSNCYSPGSLFSPASNFHFDSSPKPTFSNLPLFQQQYENDKSIEQSLSYFNHSALSLPIDTSHRQLAHSHNHNRKPSSKLTDTKINSIFSKQNTPSRSDTESVSSNESFGFYETPPLIHLNFNDDDDDDNDTEKEENHSDDNNPFVETSVNSEIVGNRDSVNTIKTLPPKFNEYLPPDLQSVHTPSMPQTRQQFRKPSPLLHDITESHQSPPLPTNHPPPPPPPPPLDQPPVHQEQIHQLMHNNSSGPLRRIPFQAVNHKDLAHPAPPPRPQIYQHMNNSSGSLHKRIPLHSITSASNPSNLHSHPPEHANTNLHNLLLNSNTTNTTTTNNNNNNKNNNHPSTITNFGKLTNPNNHHVLTPSFKKHGGASSSSSFSKLKHSKAINFKNYLSDEDLLLHNEVAGNTNTNHGVRLNDYNLTPTSDTFEQSQSTATVAASTQPVSDHLSVNKSKFTRDRQMYTMDQYLNDM